MTYGAREQIDGTTSGWRSLRTIDGIRDGRNWDRTAQSDRGRQLGLGLRKDRPLVVRRVGGRFLRRLSDSTA